MINDVQHHVDTRLSGIQRSVNELARDFQEEAEYSRSRNLIVFGWDKQDDDKDPKKLEGRMIEFINGEVLKDSGTMTNDWVSKIHYLPSRNQSASTATVMVQLALAKQMDLIWSRRLSLKDFNTNRKKEKKPAVVLEKHHTKKFGKELRYLNRIRLDMINTRKVHRDRVKINGARKDKPTLIFDGKAYTADSVTAEIFGGVGAFGGGPSSGQ